MTPRRRRSRLPDTSSETGEGRGNPGPFRIVSPDTITAVGHAASSDIAVPWWSFGKTGAAAACLALCDRGRLHLDATLPQGFTLRQLLGHRAGLTDYGHLPDYHQAVARGDAAWPVAEMLERTQAARLRYQPGQGWSYSNIGYTLVRQAIETAAETSFADALQTLVFGPLEINGAGVATNPAEMQGVWGIAEGYDPNWVYTGLLIGPAGAATRLLERLLAGDLLTPTSLAAMQESVLVGAPPEGRPWQRPGYGLGLMIGPGLNGALYTGHTGGGPGSVCAVYACAPGRAAAAFARYENPGKVETLAMSLAANPA